MRIYEADVDGVGSCYFSSRRKAEAWADREFDLYKKYHDACIRERYEQHDWGHIPDNSTALAHKVRTLSNGNVYYAINISEHEITTDKKGLTRWRNIWVSTGYEE